VLTPNVNQVVEATGMKAVQRSYEANLTAIASACGLGQTEGLILYRHPLRPIGTGALRIVRAAWQRQPARRIVPQLRRQPRGRQGLHRHGGLETRIRLARQPHAAAALFPGTDTMEADRKAGIATAGDAA